MKNMRKALLAAVTATAVTLSGTAVAIADPVVNVQTNESGADEGNGEGGDDNEIPAPGDEDGKDTSGSSDFGDVFGSFDDKGDFSFEKALASLKNVATFGTAVAGILGVIVTLSTKLPQVLEIFGIDTPSKK